MRENIFVLISHHHFFLFLAKLTVLLKKKSCGKKGRRLWCADGVQQRVLFSPQQVLLWCYKLKVHLGLPNKDRSKTPGLRCSTCWGCSAFQKASPWYPAKSQLIMRSPSQIAWPWELVKSGFTNMKLFPLASTPAEYFLPDQRAWMLFFSHKLNSRAIYYFKDVNYFIAAVENFT